MRIINSLGVLGVVMMSFSAEAMSPEQIKKGQLAKKTQQAEVAATRGDFRDAEAALANAHVIASGLRGDAAAAATLEVVDKKIEKLKAISALRAAQRAAAETRKQAQRDGDGRIRRESKGALEERVAASRAEITKDMRSRFRDQSTRVGCLGGTCKLGIDLSKVTPDAFARLDERDGPLYANRAKIFKPGMAAFIATGTFSSNLSAAQAEAGREYNNKDLLTNIQYAVRNFGAAKGIDAVIVPKTLLTEQQLIKIDGDEEGDTDARPYGNLLP